jgi:hypothetical protein
LCGIRVMSGCHDDCDLYLAAHHEEMDEAANDSLILLLIDRGGILRVWPHRLCQTQRINCCRLLKIINSLLPDIIDLGEELC